MPASLAEQNDTFRHTVAAGCPCQAYPGKFFITEGVQHLKEEDLAAVLNKLAQHHEFPEGDDPYGEHDFGHFEHAEEKYYWKFDYYDANYEFGSETPADPMVTRRVLTLMLASEY